MKSHSTSILIYGNDPMLLNTRRWVLEARRFCVVSASRLSDLGDMPLNPPFQMLILCHSVAAEECQEVLVLAELRWPGIRSLVLSGPLLKPRAGYGALRELTFNGPLHLIAAVEDLARDLAPFDFPQTDPSLHRGEHNVTVSGHRSLVQ